MLGNDYLKLLWWTKIIKIQSSFTQGHYCHSYLFPTRGIEWAWPGAQMEVGWLKLQSYFRKEKQEDPGLRTDPTTQATWKQKAKNSAHGLRRSRASKTSLQHPQRPNENCPQKLLKWRYWRCVEEMRPCWRKCRHRGWALRFQARLSDSFCLPATCRISQHHACLTTTMLSATD